MELQAGQFVILYHRDRTPYMGGIFRDDYGSIYLFKIGQAGEASTTYGNSASRFNDMSIAVDDDEKLKDFLEIVDKLNIEELKRYDNYEYVIDILTRLQERKQ